MRTVEGTARSMGLERSREQGEPWRRRANDMKAATAKVDRETRATRWTRQIALGGASWRLQVRRDRSSWRSRLGVDPRQADQNVRGTVVLPHGTGKTVRVLVFAKGEKEREARERGCRSRRRRGAGEEDPRRGWLDFDNAVATPDMMGPVGPNRKGSGAARPDAQSKARHRDFRRCPRPWRELKAGKARAFGSTRRASFTCRSVGASFGPEKLAENANSIVHHSGRR